jgi:hypothetical protein
VEAPKSEAAKPEPDANGLQLSLALPTKQSAS